MMWTRFVHELGNSALILILVNLCLCVVLQIHRGHVQCIEMIKTKLLNSHLEFDVHDVHPVDLVDGK
jgi:hypothetical protein